MADGSATAYAAGVTISICCSTLNSTGMGLQKRVHMELADVPPGLRIYWKQRRWLIGLLCMTAASLLSLGNFALLGQSRASAMASLTIITNAIMSKYYLKEQFTLVDAATTALIGTGIIIAVVFGSAAGGASKTTLDDILILLQRDVVYVATGLIIAVFIAAELYVRYAEKLGSARTHFQATVECFLRAFLAGLFSGLTGFLAKSVVVSVESMFSDKSAYDLSRYQFWMLALSLPFSVIMQLRHLNGGLRRFDAMEVVPIYQACIVTVGVAWGWTFYAENKDLAPLNEGMFAVGCLISVAGIVILSQKKKQNRDAGANKPLLGGGGSSGGNALTGAAAAVAGGSASAAAGGYQQLDQKNQNDEGEEDDSGRNSNRNYGTTVGDVTEEGTRARRGSSLTITPGTFLIEAVEALGPVSRFVDGSGGGK